MKSTNSFILSRRNQVVSEIIRQYKITGEPVALTELDFFGKLSKSEKISLGRIFKKVVQSGEVAEVRHYGRRTDNHTTYIPTDNGRSGRSIIAGIKRMLGRN